MNANTVLVTLFSDDDGGYWYPTTFTPTQLSGLLLGIDITGTHQGYRVWDTNSSGEPEPARVESNPDDRGITKVRVVNAVTNELVMETSYFNPGARK